MTENEKNHGMEVEFERYAQLGGWRQTNKVIDWCKIGDGINKQHGNLNMNWFKDAINEITDNIEDSISAEEKGTAGRIGEKIRNRSAVDKGLTKSAKSILFKLFPEEFVPFLTASIKRQAWLPVTVYRLIEDMYPYRRSNEEPCGDGEDGESRCNFGPEWIRHFLGVLYDENEFKNTTKTGNHGFFPFKNQDHLVHSLLVFLIGEVLLSAPIFENAKNAIASALCRSASEFKEVKTVRDLIVEVYRIHHSQLLTSGLSFSKWLRQVWPMVALWHDAGYDAATWCLLSFREFSHSFAVHSIMNDCHIEKVFNHLQNFLGDDLDQQVRDVLENSHGMINGYYQLWHTNECDIQHPNRRPWGRFHALFSAFEFAELLQIQKGSADRKAQVKHLAAAIAHHHDQIRYNDLAYTELNDTHLAHLFIQNPIGVLLSFADAMSGFGRIKVKEMNETQGVGLSEVSDSILNYFCIDCDVTSIQIWKSDDSQRYRFYRGLLKPSDYSKMRIKIRSLWGEFMEDVSEEDVPQQCPRVKLGRCSLSDLKGIVLP